MIRQDGLRNCTKCGETKSISDFYPVPVGDGISRRCKECKKTYEKERRKAHPEIYRDYELRSHFKVTHDKYEEMFKAQNGVCWLCGEPETVTRKEKLLPLTIDHDHDCCPGEKSCGKCVRGLLCFRCNSGLGYFKDKPELLHKAAEYIVNKRNKA